MSTQRLVDCLIIGAGPAGLTAALYLRRFRREVAIYDTGASRATWIPRSHNLPGFPQGIHGPDLITALKHQLESCDLKVTQQRVGELRREGDDFIAEVADGDVKARTVLIAAGVAETLPASSHVNEAIRSGVVRTCPICDGFEAQGRRVGVLGRGDHAAREALFLRTYCENVTVILDREDAPSPDIFALLKKAAVAVLHADLANLIVGLDGVEVVDCDGVAHVFELVYSAFGVTPQTVCIRGLGARLDIEGRLIVNEHQETSAPGLYAAGDIVRGLNQISVAEGEAAIAATAIHNRLHPNYLTSPTH